MIYLNDICIILLVPILGWIEVKTKQNRDSELIGIKSLENYQVLLTFWLDFLVNCGWKLSDKI